MTEFEKFKRRMLANPETRRAYIAARIRHLLERRRR